MKSVSAALEALTEDSERRIRVYRTEEARAEERATDLQAFRDLETRSSIAGKDRDVLAVTAENLNTTTSIALEASVVARRRREEAEHNYAETKEKLQAEVNRAAKRLKQRECILESIVGRLEESIKMRNKASQAYACSAAGVKALQTEFDAAKARVEGELAEAVEEAAAAVKAAEQALLVAKKAVADTERCTEVAELQALERQELKESCLAQALDKARIAAFEAKFHAEIGSIRSHADEGQVAEQLEELDELLSSTTANLADSQRRQKIAEAAYGKACRALEATQARLQKAYDDSEEEGSKHSEEELAAADASPGFAARARIAALEARANDLEREVKERDAERLAAISALEAAMEEMQRVTEDRRNAPKPTFSLEGLLQEELDLMHQCIDGHIYRKSDLKAELAAKEAGWKDENDRLRIDLHSASLQLSVAEERVKSVTHLQKEVMETKST